MIYFMQPVDGGPVKIGFSDNVAVRHRQLEARYGRELAILAVQDGGEIEERAIHDRFAHLRLPGKGKRGVMPEQFKPGLDLMEFIDRPLLVDQNPESTEVMLPRGFELAIRFPGELHKRIQAAADTEGNSIAAFIRSAVVKELKRREREDQA